MSKFYNISSKNKLIISCYFEFILCVYYFNQPYSYFVVYMALLFCLLYLLPKISTKFNLLNRVPKLKLLFILLSVFLFSQIFMVLVISLLVVSIIGGVLVIYTKMNELTFHKFFFRVNPKVRYNEMVRLYLVPPTGMTNPIFETKQSLLKTLHSFGDVPVNIGEFQSSPTFQTKGFDIWKKYFESRKQIANQITVGFEADKNEIKQFIDVPTKYRKKLTNILKSTYLGLQVEESKNEIKMFQGYTTSRGYIHGNWRSRLKTFKDEQVDPLNSMILSLESIPENARVEISYNLISLGDFYNAIVDEKLEIEPIDNPNGGAKSQSRQSTSQEKAQSFLWKLGIEIKCYSELKELSDYIIGDIQSSYLTAQEVEGNRVCFDPRLSENSLNQSVVSDSDLWSLWHIVSNSPKLNVSRHQPLPYPNELIKFTKFVTEFGKSNYPNFEGKTVGIPTNDDKFKHLSIFGKSGSGKSTFSRNLFRQDCEGCFPIFFMDFKGETAPQLLTDVPDNRLNDVVYISPAEYILPMSIFDEDPKEIMLLLDILSGIGNQNIEGAFGDTVERISNTLATIISKLDKPTARAIQYKITQILDSKQDVKGMKMSQNMMVKIFGSSVDATTRQRLVDALTSTINKFGKLLIDDVCIQSMDNPNAKLNFKDCIEQNKIVIINLPESLGERERTSLSIFYTLKILFAIKSQKEFKQTAFYLDEAQVVMNMLSTQFENSFSQLRSMKCAITTANQYSSQTKKEVVDSIRSNVSNLVVLGLLDNLQIENEADQLGIDIEEYSKDNFRLLPLGNGYARVVCEGSLIPSTTFQFDTLPPINRNINKIKNRCKKEYGIKPYEFVPEGIKKTTNKLLDSEIKLKPILTKRPDRRNVKKIKSL